MSHTKTYLFGIGIVLSIGLLAGCGTSTEPSQSSPLTSSNEVVPGPSEGYIDPATATDIKLQVDEVLSTDRLAGHIVEAKINGDWIEVSETQPTLVFRSFKIAGPQPGECGFEKSMDYMTAEGWEPGLVTGFKMAWHGDHAPVVNEDGEYLMYRASDGQIFADGFARSTDEAENTKMKKNSPLPGLYDECGW